MPEGIPFDPVRERPADDDVHDGLEYFFQIPGHDLTFGLQPDLVADRLTLENWRTRATLRRFNGRLLYVYVYVRWFTPEGGGGHRFALHVTALGPAAAAPDLGRDFPTLEAALAAADLGEPVPVPADLQRGPEASIVVFPRWR